MRSNVYCGNLLWQSSLTLPCSKAQIPTTAANGCVWTGNFCRFRVGDAHDKVNKMPGSKTEMSRLYTRYNIWNKDPAAFGTFQFVE